MRTITLSQKAYADTVVARFNMENAYPCTTPLDRNVTLSTKMSPTTPTEIADMQHVPYRKLIGSLMYLAVGTRPDIAFAVQFLSQFLANPGRAHWEAAKRVIRYILGTRKFTLNLGGKQPICLTGYTDSDYAGDISNRKSTSGYVFSLGTTGTGLISWSSKKQATVTTSSCEAEYIAACHSAKETIWLRALLAAIGFPQKGATRVAADNQGAIALTKDPSVHARTKHIDVQYHFVRERVAMGEISYHYIHTSTMIADAMTKGLPAPAHTKFRRMMGISDPNWRATPSRKSKGADSPNWRSNPR